MTAKKKAEEVKLFLTEAELAAYKELMWAEWAVKKVLDDLILNRKNIEKSKMDWETAVLARLGVPKARFVIDNISGELKKVGELDD